MGDDQIRKLTEHLSRLEGKVDELGRGVADGNAKVDALAEMIHGEGAEPGFKGRLMRVEDRVGTITWFGSLCVGAAITCGIGALATLIF